MFQDSCRANEGNSLSFSLKNRVLKHWCLAVFRGPGGFKELQEACWNHFHLSRLHGAEFWPKKISWGFVCYQIPWNSSPRQGDITLKKALFNKKI